MSDIRWSLAKSEKLKIKRGVSFEEILRAKLVAVKEHPKRSHQNIMLFELNGYIWVVPYVKEGKEFFLKTLFPSRQYTKMWQRGGLK